VEPRLPLKITVFAAVEAVLAGLDSFFTLWSHSHPVLHRCIPVQIAVLDDLSDFEESRIIRRRWLALGCLAHASL
jgi:hypothetical protein